MPPRPLPQPVAHSSRKRYLAYQPQKQDETSRVFSDSRSVSPRGVYNNSIHYDSESSNLHDTRPQGYFSYSNYVQSSSSEDLSDSSASQSIVDRLDNYNTSLTSSYTQSNTTTLDSIPPGVLDSIVPGKTQTKIPLNKHDAYDSFDKITLEPSIKPAKLEPTPPQHKVQPKKLSQKVESKHPQGKPLPGLDHSKETPDYHVKIVCVGDGGCGKTSLMLTYTIGQFPTTYVPTVFDNYATTIKAPNDKYVELALWDTAGQEEYDRLRVLSYHDVDIFLVCFGVDTPTSLENVIDKWVPEVSHFCPNIPFILVGLKTDLRKEDKPHIYTSRSVIKSITEEQGNYIAKKVGAAAYLECSSRSNLGVSDVFSTAMNTVLKKEFSQSVIDTSVVDRGVNSDRRRRRNFTKSVEPARHITMEPVVVTPRQPVKPEVPAHTTIEEPTKPAPSIKPFTIETPMRPSETEKPIKPASLIKPYTTETGKPIKHALGKPTRLTSLENKSTSRINSTIRNKPENQSKPNKPMLTSPPISRNHSRKDDKNCVVS